MKRARSFAAWISSFTFCCCCINPFAIQPVPMPDPVVINQPQPQPQPQPNPEPEKPPKKNPPEKKIGGDSKVTRANFALIKTGMTLDQVEAILGPGEEFGTNARSEQRNFLWRNMDLAPPPTINLIFRRGGVIVKHMAP